jgi:hypothetical protein
MDVIKQHRAPSKLGERCNQALMECIPLTCDGWVISATRTLSRSLWQQTGGKKKNRAVTSSLLATLPSVNRALTDRGSCLVALHAVGHLWLNQNKAVPRKFAKWRPWPINGRAPSGFAGTFAHVLVLPVWCKRFARHVQLLPITAEFAGVWLHDFAASTSLKCFMQEVSNGIYDMPAFNWFNARSVLTYCARNYSCVKRCQSEFFLDVLVY